jgi:DtxR family Mn-dependent transcriptional regulator
MPHTSAVEDTLRTVFVRSGRSEPVSTSALADELHVSPPTVSIMLKRLTTAGLLRRTDGHLAALTEHGAAHARDVVRRHRLLEAFLAQELDVPWDEVHAEADALEHAVSDRLIDRIDRHLGRPDRDPHGDPIPRGTGGLDEGWGVRLDAAPDGSAFDVERVYDRDSAALRYLAGLGPSAGRCGSASGSPTTPSASRSRTSSTGGSWHEEGPRRARARRAHRLHVHRRVRRRTDR